MDNILVEELNLISLKVMFCKSVSMTFIATRYYNVWYDEMIACSASAPKAAGMYEVEA